MNPEIDTFKEKLEAMQNTFYEKQGGKSWFQKDKQKINCAVAITQSIPLNDLLDKTFTIVTNTNKVVIEYPIFKTFANPSNYNEIISYILTLFTDCIDKHGSFEVHVNLKSFTITAAQRYCDMICQFCKECLDKDTRFTTKITSFAIYNCPKMFDSISALFSGFIDDQIRSKIHIVS
jgi:CRAL/TRIO domain